MAFNNRALSVIAYTNGFTCWLYIANERIEHILGKGYFNPITQLLNDGDEIHIVDGSDLYIRSIWINGNTVKLKNTK